MKSSGIRRAPLVIVGIGLMLAACESQLIYEGERPSKDQQALILGDPRVSAGLPVSIFIRRVDGAELGLRYRGARVAAGEHDLLIDCTVTESQHTSRHHLHVDVDAGVKYRLVANTGVGNRECTEVQLVARY
jgi:hypothetical protein